MYTLADIIDYLQEDVQNRNTLTAEVLNRPITALAQLAQANATQIAFLAQSRHNAELAQTSAAAVLITADMADQCPTTTVALIVASPYEAYAKISALFAYQPKPSVAIHPTAIIAPTAKLGDAVTIGAYCVIGEHVIVGDNSKIGAYVTLEDNVHIGQHCQLSAHVYIGHHCLIGDYTALHSHASIGNEGFGYAPKGDIATQGWQKIHQLGRVVIGEHVRIGSHTCIDRGALEDTIIGNHVIIDNLVQIAHNVHIGDGTAIAACVGIAGSTHIGRRCIIAGAVGINGHINICDDVTLTGMAMVTKSITQSGSYSSGIPVMPTALWRRAAVKFKQLVNTSKD